MSDPNFNAFDQSGGAERSEIIPASTPMNRSGSTALLTRPVGDRLATTTPAFDPLALLRSFRKRWVLALSLGITSAIVVGIILLIVVPPAKYTSRSLIRVMMRPPKVIFDTQSDVYADYRTFQITQTQLIKSRFVLEPALSDPSVAGLSILKAHVDPAEWLEKQIEVTLPSGSEILTVGLTSSNPDEIKPIVDAVVKAYLKNVVEADHLSRSKRLEQLQMMWNKKQEELKSKRKSIRKLADETGSDDKPTLVLKQSFQLENIHSLEQELLKIQGDLRQYNPYLSLIEKDKTEPAGPSVVPPMLARQTENSAAPVAMPSHSDDAVEAAVADQLSAHPQTADINDRITSLSRKVQHLKGLARHSDDPALNAARSELQGHKARLTDLRSRIRDSIISTRNQGGDRPITPGSTSGSPNEISLRDRIAILKSREASLQKDIDKYRVEVAKLNGTTMDLQTEKDEIDLFNATTQKIGSEVEFLGVELDAPKRIVKLTDAEPPRKKDAVKQYLMCGGAAFGAFALAMLGVSFWEMRAMRIDSVNEVVSHLGLALVGALPALPNRTGKTSKADDQRWQGLLVESIDATRTMLLHASRANSTRAVMITSAMKGEGKTSLAAHLATSLARSGRKTLLIDCDLRRPRLHELFDVARVPGLCELLRGEAEVNDVIRPTPADDLNMIPAGHCDGLALQAIAQDGLRDVLNILKKRYDFIIIDSAPVLPVVDTMLLSQQVDAVLFSIMRDVSRVPHVQAAHERLAGLGVKMLGAVMSAADRRDYMHIDNYEYETAERS